MAQKICSDVFKINADSNVYLILNPEPFLIDTSYGNYSELLKSEIKKIIPLESIKKILLTHLHYDHSGNLDLFPDADVYVSKEELDDFNKDASLFFLDNLTKEAVDKIKSAKELPKEINGLGVISVPGHTRGSVAFLDEKRKLLFSGDCLFENGVGRTDFENSVPYEMDNSIDKLKKLLFENNLKLCCGHDY